MTDFYRLLRPYDRPLDADGGALSSSAVRRYGEAAASR
jgi:hypothetical protein